MLSISLVLAASLAAARAPQPASKPAAKAAATPAATPPKYDIGPAVARDFDSFDVRIESGKSSDLYFPYKIFAPPPGKSPYESVPGVFAVITLRSQTLGTLPGNRGATVVGELVFMRGNDVPLDHGSSAGNTWGAVLYYPRSDFDDVLKVLQIRKTGTILFYQACTFTSGDTRACWLIGKLIFLEKAPDGAPYNWSGSDVWWLP